MELSFKREVEFLKVNLNLKLEGKLQAGIVSFKVDD